MKTNLICLIQWFIESKMAIRLDYSHDLTKEFLRYYGGPAHNQVRSYNAMVAYMIPKIIETWTLEGKHMCYGFVFEGRLEPTTSNVNKHRPMFPSEARLHDLTYQGQLRVYVYQYPPGQKPTRPEEYNYLRDAGGNYALVSIGMIPIMVKSAYCSTQIAPKMGMPIGHFGELDGDPGGYYIFAGTERILLMNEHLLRHMTIEDGTRAKDTRGSARRTIYSSIVCEDGPITRVVRVVSFYNPDQKTETMKVLFGDFRNRDPKDGGINLVDLFILLGYSFEDIIDMIMLFVKDSTMEKRIRMEAFLYPTLEDSKLGTVFSNVLEIEKRTFLTNLCSNTPGCKTEEFQDIETFYQKTRRKIINDLYPHVPAHGFILKDMTDADEFEIDEESEEWTELDEDTQDQIRAYQLYKQRKAVLLGIMTSNVIQVVLGIRPMTDRDSFAMKFINSSAWMFGMLIAQHWKNTCRGLQVDLETYERGHGTAFPPEQIRSGITSQATKLGEACKEALASGRLASRGLNVPGNYRSKANVETVNDDSFIARVTHLNTVNTPTTRVGPQISARNIHGSSVYHVCAAETPDSEKIGLHKKLTVFETLTVMNQYILVLQILEQVFLENPDLTAMSFSPEPPCSHMLIVNGMPLTWVNGPELKKLLVRKRRHNEFPYEASLVLENNGLYFWIRTQPGRVCTPFLVMEDGDIKAIRDGKHMSRWDYLRDNGYIEYMDAAEFEYDTIVCDGVRYLHMEQRTHSELVDNIKLLKQRHTDISENPEAFEWTQEETSLKTVLDEAQDQLEKNNTEKQIPFTRKTYTHQEVLGYLIAQKQRLADDLLKQLKSYTHCPIDPSGIFGFSAAGNPVVSTSQGPRIAYGAKIHGQAVSAARDNSSLRTDSKARSLMVGNAPLFYTNMARLLGHDKYPNGATIILAVMPYAGKNQEDSIILNKKALWKFMQYVRLTEKHTLVKGGQHNSRFIRPIPKPGELSKFDHLDSYGFAKVGSWVDANNIIAGVIRYPAANEQKITQIYLPKVKEINDLRDLLEFEINRSAPPDHVENLQRRIAVLVDQFHKNPEIQSLNVDTSESLKVKIGNEGTVEAVLKSKNYENNETIKVVIKQIRIPQPGDKFSSRYAQKATASDILDDTDLPIVTVLDADEMPYDENTGIVPDAIINPHCIPSRMTPGMVLEMVIGTLDLLGGTRTDASPFRPVSRIVETLKQLEMFGYRSNGSMKLYHRKYKRAYPAEVLIGPIQYLALRHQVHEKSQVRGGIGQMHDRVTRQPVAGRKRQGGLRFGEMENLCVIGHGAAGIMQDRLCDNSDKFFVTVCINCNRFAHWAKSSKPGYYCENCKGKNFARIKTRYAMIHFFRLLSAANIVPQFELIRVREGIDLQTASEESELKLMLKMSSAKAGLTRDAGEIEEDAGDLEELEDTDDEEEAEEEAVEELPDEEDIEIEGDDEADDDGSDVD